MRPVVSDPQLCALRELQDGTYSIDDLCDFHEVLDAMEVIRNGTGTANK